MSFETALALTGVAEAYPITSGSPYIEIVRGLATGWAGGSVTDGSSLTLPPPQADRHNAAIAPNIIVFFIPVPGGYIF
ncbi:hypothetical protein BTH42_17045 [Burkholderia sp. SRS-W-2-2016]|nr:hypothetical protein BTH42_17045 [Burkholderia sp. SRS-W-2-2016]